MALWDLGIGYLAVLSLAAGWATVERVRTAVAERKRTLLDEIPARPRRQLRGIPER